MRIVTIDFETKEIVKGAPRLPVPVGVAIKIEDQPGEYLAWGHPSNNNCTFEEAKARLEAVWDDNILGHNSGGFDNNIAVHYFGLRPKRPDEYEDTLFLAYLNNPNSRDIGLKELAAELLGLDPEEQTELYDWIVLNVPQCRGRGSAGAYISEAPGDLVGKYAVGDVDRTYLLYKALEPVKESMSEAYLREKELAILLSEIQIKGVRCDLIRLCNDYVAATKKLLAIDDLIRKRLNSPDLNVGSDKELAGALVRAGFKNFNTTAKGAVSVDKKSLERALEHDQELKEMLYTRATYSTLTGTFMYPWIQYAKENGGRIHASYNQVVNPEGYGTRTGRLSSSNPNFQNVPKKFKRKDYWGDEFPVMRSYLLPDEGHEWTCGDFKNQEPRLAAHFEDGELMAAFNENPELDPYIFVVETVDGQVVRDEAKTIFLGLLYAMGAGALAERLGKEMSYANWLKGVVKSALPDIVTLDATCKRRFNRGEPIRTLGGRYYYCEPPSNGRNWSYKALNTLIQGSAADQTKEALIHAAPRLRALHPSIRILGTVHDEYSVSHPTEYREQVIQIMRESANALKCDVPMLMDIHSGERWSEAK